MRKWIRIGFDGVPYRIACDTKEKLVNFPKFNVEIDEANTSLALHLSEKHWVTDMSCLIIKKGIQDVILVPGTGHMEKNMLLAIFSLCRNIFLERLAELLGFRTKNSREFIMNCGNHHVAWQILYISFEAFSKDLVRVFVTESLREKKFFQAIILFVGETIE